MATDIVMPRLSDSMEEGTILKWLKSPGDSVELGEELVEIETDKANMVYEADAGGTLIEIVAAEGDTLPIGQVIARVGEAGEAVIGWTEGVGSRESPSPVRWVGRFAGTSRPCCGPSPGRHPLRLRSPRGPTAGTCHHRRRRAGQGLPARTAHRPRARARPGRACRLRAGRANRQGRR